MNIYEWVYEKENGYISRKKKKGPSEDEGDRNIFSKDRECSIPSTYKVANY